MKETIKNFMKKNGLNYKDYIIAYIIGYPLAIGMVKQVIYSPTHIYWVINTMITLSLIAIHKQDVLTTWDARGIGIHVFIKHMPIPIVLWGTRMICSMGGINTELIFGW